MSDEESLARRLCFQVGGNDPDTRLSNGDVLWRHWLPNAHAALAWLKERRPHSPDETSVAEDQRG